MKATKLKNVKKGEYFLLTDNVKYNEDDEVLEKYVYVRDDYDRGSKRYEVHKFNDICSYRLIKGDKIVYTDFRF